MFGKEIYMFIITSYGNLKAIGNFVNNFLSLRLFYIDFHFLVP